MSATQNLLDIYAKQRQLKTDSEIAASLKVSKQAVSGWRNEKAHPDAESVARMCDATGQSVAHWLPLIEADRARNPEARKVWLRLAQAAAAVALIVCLDKGGGHAYLAMLFATHNSGTLYIMSN